MLTAAGGLADRVGALDGRVEIDTPPGAVIELDQERPAGGVGEHHPRARRLSAHQ